MTCPSCFRHFDPCLVPQKSKRLGIEARCPFCRWPMVIVRTVKEIA